MSTKDIYKLDNILVPAGWIVLFFWAPACASILLASFGPGLHLILCLAPAAMLVAGYRVRARENRYIALWRILENTSRITVGELVQSTHFTADEIKEGIRTINSTGRAFFSLEPHSGQIINSGMADAAAAAAVECPSCGATNKARVFLGAVNAKCEYCGEGLQRDVDARPGNVTPSPVHQVQSTQPRSKQSDFNVGTFVLLCLFFWPAAMAYYFRHKQ